MDTTKIYWVSLSFTTNEKTELERELKQFREVLQGLKAEYEKKSGYDHDVHQLMQQLRQKEQKLTTTEKELTSKQEETDSKQKTINELISEKRHSKRTSGVL